MVWGLEPSSGFGEFSLEGDFIGFDDALKDYFLNQMPDAEKAEMGMQEYFHILHSAKRRGLSETVFRPADRPVSEQLLARPER